MRLQNAITGDVLELPTPDELGQRTRYRFTLYTPDGKYSIFDADIAGTRPSDTGVSVELSNVDLVERGNHLSLGDGLVFAAGDEFADFVTGVLSGGAV